ncbi:MAG: glycosyl hydrolase [Deltaproteobacteria bacterium]|nr:glycosyl hydrolase [Deltaproteobacteria bacterium]
MPICLSPNGTATFSSERPSDDVVVGTAQGVVTINRGTSGLWTVGANALQECHISSLMIEPLSGLMFAGVHGGALYASDDHGRTWVLKNKGIAHDHVYCLSYVHDNGLTKLYAGTEPAHLYVSHNLGESWEELTGILSVPSVPKWTFPAPPHIGHVKNITFDPGHAKTIYVGIEQGGLLKSTDGGSSWSELHGFHDDVHRLVIKRSDPSSLYMANGDGLFHSSDSGVTWEQWTNRSMRIGYPDGLLMHPHREELMFMSGGVNAPSQWRASRTADARIARSRDGGRSWEMLHQGLPEHLRANTEALMMEAWKESFALFVGTTDGDIFYSDDEGEHWSNIVAGMPAISKGRHFCNLNEVAA